MIKIIWGKWKILAEKVGNFQASLLFSVLFFVLVTPFGLITNFFNDFLNLKNPPSWTNWEDNSSDLEKMKSQ